jgi:dTMP kinase
MSGKFISFEGGEGSGKSTQIRLLSEAFAAAGIAHVQTREPGGTPGAERIRNLLVSGSADAWDAEAETLLFCAARVDHASKLIRPALGEGRHVICDRFVDSTMVYQGVGKGLAEPYIRMLHRLTLGNLMPDLTLVLDIDPAAGLQRAQARAGNETRFEGLGLEFHTHIRAGFLGIAQREPGRCAVIDATGGVEAVHAQVVDAVRLRLALLV